MERITTTIFNYYLANQYHRSYSKLGQAQQRNSGIAAASFFTGLSSYPIDSVAAHYSYYLECVQKLQYT